MKFTFVNAAVFLLLLAGCGQTQDGSGVVESVPNFSPVTDLVRPYIANFKTNSLQDVRVVAIPATNSLHGFIQWTNQLEDACIIQTSEDKNDVSPGQRLYFWEDKRGQFVELNLTSLGNARIGNPQLALRGAAFVALLETRTTRSSVFLYDIDAQHATRISAGGSVQVSPDGRSAAVLRRDEQGFCSIHVLRLADLQMDPAISIWESDPGSGVSFSYRWALDSKALLIEGTHGGFHRSDRGNVEQFKYLYFPETKQIFDLKTLL